MDHIKGSTLHNLRNSDRRGAPPIPDPVRLRAKRRAVLLVAGDKAGNWKAWYDTKIPNAEHRYGQWIKEQEDE
jgi:hypothetical protein